MQYCCTVKLYCKPYGVYTVKDFIGYLSSLYYCCFTCLRLAKAKVQLKSKCPNDINTECAIPEKLLSFLLDPWKFHILNPPPPSIFPLFIFFYYNVCTVISDCNHPFETSTFTHSLTRIHFIAIESKYLNGGDFLK